MINLEEYKRFKHLEHDPFVRKLERLNGVFAGAMMKLDDGQIIPVRYWGNGGEPQVFDYYLTPWGVLTYLGKGNYDKSPLCTKLDEAIVKEFDKFLERNNLNAAQSR